MPTASAAVALKTNHSGHTSHHHPTAGVSSKGVSSVSSAAPGVHQQYSRTAAVSFESNTNSRDVERAEG